MSTAKETGKLHGSQQNGQERHEQREAEQHYVCEG